MTGYFGTFFKLNYHELGALKGLIKKNQTHPQLSSPLSFICLCVCRAFPRSGPDPAQIGFQAISVPTRSICSESLSVFFFSWRDKTRTTMTTAAKGLKKGKRRNIHAAAAQKNKPDANEAGPNMSLTRETSRAPKESCLWIQGHALQPITLNVCVSVSVRMCVHVFIRGSESDTFHAAQKALLYSITEI